MGASDSKIAKQKKKKLRADFERKMPSDFLAYISSASNYQSFTEQALVSGADVDELEQIVIPGNQLNVSHYLGHGHYGIVSRGYRNRFDTNSIDLVAIRKLRWSCREEFVDLLSQAAVLHNYEHANLLKFIGVAVVDDEACMIAPYVPGGTLHKYLRLMAASRTDNNNNSHRHLYFPVKVLIDLCHQVCCGMLYLSSKDCYHPDLRCKNILIGENLQLKIADFGLSRRRQRNNNNNDAEELLISQVIPNRWHPPESLKHGVFEHKSDVWSFGVVVWEIFTQCAFQPYGNLKNSEVSAVISSGIPLPRPERCGDEIYEDVMLKCWQFDRLSRPSYSELLNTLQSIARGY